MQQGYTSPHQIRPQLRLLLRPLHNHLLVYIWYTQNAQGTQEILREQFTYCNVQNPTMASWMRTSDCILLRPRLPSCFQFPSVQNLHVHKGVFVYADSRVVGKDSIVACALDYSEIHSTLRSSAPTTNAPVVAGVVPTASLSLIEYIIYLTSCFFFYFDCFYPLLPLMPKSLYLESHLSNPVQPHAMTPLPLHSTSLSDST